MTPAEIHAAKWKGKFPDPTHRGQWRQHFIDPDVAARFRAIGFDPETAAAWFATRLSDEAITYLHQHSHTPNVQALTALRISPRFTIGYGPNRQRDMDRAAALFHARPHLTFTAVSAIVTAGYTLTEADALLAALPIDDVLTIARAGINADEALTLIASGTYDRAALTTLAGLT